MNIQKMFPIIFRRQKARLINKAEISYLVSRNKVTISFKEVNKISFTPICCLVGGIILVIIFDIVVFGKNGTRHKLINISKEGHDQIINLLKGYPSIQLEHTEMEPGILINGFVRLL